MEEMGCWVTDSLPSFARNLHILLVDQDPVSLKHLASLLEQQSYNVTMTQLASVALSMIWEKGDRFNLVMANASMPDMDIFSFLRMLLKKNIAVIFMSSGTNLNVATKALAEGACYFLQKPIAKEDLKYIWQHVYQRNRNVIKQTHKANCIEKARPGKESIGVKLADAVVLSQSGAANNYNNGINCQPIINKRKEKNKQIESHDSLVGSKFGGKRSIDDMEGINREKRVKFNSEPAKFGSTRIDVDCEKRKEYYISSESRSCVVWDAERRRKFTDALNKLGDEIRPKHILKMMNEPCLTLRQVANHLQKYKAQAECVEKKRENKLPPRQASRSNFSARTQFPPLPGKQHHETSKFGKGGLSSVIGGDRFRLIAPKTLPNPGLPVSDFVNHSLRTLNHNFQHVGLNYNSASTNINNEVGLYPDKIQRYRKEGNTFHTDNTEEFALGGGVQTSELNLPNVSSMIPEIASAGISDGIQFPDNLLDVIQQLDLTDFEIENQEAVEYSGTTNEFQSMPGEIAFSNPKNVAADFIDGSDKMGKIEGQELPVCSANEESQPLAEYADLLNVLEDDPYNFGSDINLSDVDKYCEWLRNTVLENGSGPDSFISDGAEKVPIENTQ